jgi:hypothetical protein
MPRFVANTEFHTPTSTRNNSTTMTAIDEAIEDLNSQGPNSQKTYKAVAEKHGVVDTTLRRRYLSQTTTRATQHARQRVLTPQQDNELLQWIQEETQGRNPPAWHLVAQKASLLAGRPVGKNWVYKFLHRYNHLILSRRAAPMERVRASADSHMKYEAYFTYILSKVEEYSILPEQTYNMDEKGIALGMMNASTRIFSRKQWDRKQVRAPIHDGSREWITILACICADGSALSPALIYQSDASNVQSSWVEDINLEQAAFVTASKSGWTNNDIGLQWLIQVFDRLTKPKARLQWRLLYVDGHASHVSVEFLDYCVKSRILVARFPPHATHTVQPLDVVVFRSLSAAYNRALDDFKNKSRGLISIAKRDFFSIFWRAWEPTMQPSLIKKAFEATGLSPLNPAVVLERFESDSSDDEEGGSTNPLNSWQQLNRRFREVVKDPGDPRTQELNEAIHHLHNSMDIHRHAVNDLEQALATKIKRKKPGKPLQQPGDGGAMFYSPRSVEQERQRMRDEEKAQEEEEARKQQIKVNRAAQRAIEDRDKQQRAQQRAENKAKKDEDERVKRLQKEEANAAKAAKKHQDEIDKRARDQARTRGSISRGRGGRGRGGKRGGRAEGSAPPAPPPAPPTTRNGRDIITPARYR